MTHLSVTEADIQSAIDAVLEREGGFVDHPSDRGGATNFGITAGKLGEWRRLGRVATGTEVIALSKAEARAIYKAEYAQPFLFLEDARVFVVAFDAAVNHGVRQAIRFLQKSVGVAADGVIGPVTRAAIVAMPPEMLRKRFLANRVRDYGRIISKDHTQAVFAAGWMNRVAEQIEA